jgi:hypothetical protein
MKRLVLSFLLFMALCMPVLAGNGQGQNGNGQGNGTRAAPGLLWVPDFQSWQSDTASIGSSDGGADRSIDIFALFVRTRS